MKKVIINLAVMLTLVATSNFAYSNPVANATIAVLNLEEIKSSSLAIKNINEQIQKKEAEFVAEIEKKSLDLKKQNDQLVKQQSILNEKAMEEKAKEFNNKVAEAQKDEQNKRTILGTAQMNAFEVVDQAVTKIVNQQAAENKFTLLMPSSSLFYFDPKLDITQDVLKKLNDSLKKVTVKFDNVK